ncbi:STAS domain-containing protein [Mycobacterium sp. pUA109]|uniref:STAS domain-containing protein n=1 Tax=Mycobacterium sp. pUA109 TaxID=3238982 RepID=UPI00351ABBCC
MSAIRAAESALPPPRTDTAFPPQTWESHTAHSTARWGRSGAVISVGGELDAANAGQLADYVQRCADYCEWLVLDLHDLEFIGTAGFSTLQTINTRCTHGKIYWAMVPSSAVTRLLRICDPDSALPTTESVAAALATVQSRSRLLQLVTEPS